ncbi:MAG: hypothetical protein EPN49_07970 [Rhodanobacter sp.]|nr:MAG: hypothetical protein EPN49_07970 [Rhodanobacter sp.]
MTFRTTLLMTQCVTHDVLRFIVARPEGFAFEPGRVDEALLKRLIVDWDQHFYVCGPPPFNDAVMLALRQLGAQPEALIFEQ